MQNAKNPNKNFILQPCPAFVSGIKKSNPKMLPYLAPIQSPLMCMAQYLRKYQNYSGELAYLSPCIAKRLEINDKNHKAAINKWREILGVEFPEYTSG